MKGWITLHVLFKTQEQMDMENIGVDINKSDAVWIENDIKVCNIGAIYHDIDNELIVSYQGSDVIVKESKETVKELIKKALEN